MAYRKKEFRFKNAVEVNEYHTARYGMPGQHREKRRKPTPEQMEKINQRKREETCRHKLRAHFTVSDYFTTLTYAREKRPADMDEAKDQFRQFVRRVRREYKKRGCELKWISNIEVGSKGAWHVHMVVNRIPDTDVIISEAWQYGRIKNELMYQDREFAPLAAYMTKTPKADKRLVDAHYSCSRNLPVPPPREKIYSRWKTWHSIRIPDGWYLDQESLIEDVNPITGYPYRHYTLLRVRRI